MVCVCVYRAHSDFSSVSRPQGSLGNTSSSSCPLPPNKQTESFLQVFMEPLTHAPPHSIWKSSDLANFERPLEEEGMVVGGGAEGCLACKWLFWKKHFLFFDAPNSPVRWAQTGLWPPCFEEIKAQWWHDWPRVTWSGGRSSRTRNTALSIQGSKALPSLLLQHSRHWGWAKKDRPTGRVYQQRPEPLRWPLSVTFVTAECSNVNRVGPSGRSGSWPRWGRIFVDEVAWWASMGCEVKHGWMRGPRLGVPRGCDQASHFTSPNFEFLSIRSGYSNAPLRDGVGTEGKNIE